MSQMWLLYETKIDTQTSTMPYREMVIGMVPPFEEDNQEEDHPIDPFEFMRRRFSMTELDLWNDDWIIPNDIKKPPRSTISSKED